MTLVHLPQPPKEPTMPYTELTATYTDLTPEDDDYTEEGGYTDPHNPWGGFTSPMPNTPQEAGYATWAAWSAENVETVTLTLLEAAQFVIDFPGAVWDFVHDCEPSIMDYATGRQRQVTLHIGDHAETVFALAAALTSVSA